MSEKPKFFKTQAAFRKWLSENHQRKEVLWVGYYKKATKKPSITWDESVDEGLCFGWIDGLRKSIDEESYKIRFTPRKPTSHWSIKNINRINELIELKLVQPAGLEAYGRRKEKNSGRFSYEQEQVGLSKAYESKLKSNKKAWKYFQATSPTYRRKTSWWVMSAKQEATRLRRLNILIESSAKGELVPPMQWSK